MEDLSIGSEIVLKVVEAEKELNAKVGIQMKMDFFVLLRSISLIGNLLKNWRISL